VNFKLTHYRCMGVLSSLAQLVVRWPSFAKKQNFASEINQGDSR